MYQNHLAGVPNSAQRTQVKILPTSVHVVLSRFSPSLPSVSILFLGNSYSSSKTQRKCTLAPEAFPDTRWQGWFFPLVSKSVRTLFYSSA